MLIADTLARLIMAMIASMLAAMGPAQAPEPEPEPEPEPIVRRYGDYGLLVIPSVGVDVRLYSAAPTREDYARACAIVDAPDSAVILTQTAPEGYDDIYDDGQRLIGDHNDQGFGGIKKCGPGDEAYIYYPDGTYDRYIWGATDYNGTNGIPRQIPHNGDMITLNGIYHADGRSGYKGNPDGITLYTCNQDSHHVTIVEFYPAD